MEESSGNEGEGGRGKCRHAIGCSGRGERESLRHYATCELDLEGIVTGRLRVRERRLGGAAKSGFIRMCNGQYLLGTASPPGLEGDPAERDPRLDDGGPLDFQGGGGRDDREGVGGALANLEVAGMRRKSSRLCRQTDGDEQHGR